MGMHLPRAFAGRRSDFQEQPIHSRFVQGISCRKRTVERSASGHSCSLAGSQTGLPKSRRPGSPEGPESDVRQTPPCWFNRATSGSWGLARKQTFRADGVGGSSRPMSDVGRESAFRTRLTLPDVESVRSRAIKPRFPAANCHIDVAQPASTRHDSQEL